MAPQACSFKHKPCILLYFLLFFYFCDMKTRNGQIMVHVVVSIILDKIFVLINTTKTVARLSAFTSHRGNWPLYHLKIKEVITMCSNPQGLTGLGGLLRWSIVKMEQKSISTATPFSFSPGQRW